jgi:hypothetical protein|tara:strand:+ start:1856 stop:1978 length:123 start_codon:yes stop_codon:yes gene_type:complete
MCPETPFALASMPVALVPGFLDLQKSKEMLFIQRPFTLST